jgi:hypothetical protein
MKTKQEQDEAIDWLADRLDAGRLIVRGNATGIYPTGELKEVQLMALFCINEPDYRPALCVVSAGRSHQQRRPYSGYSVSWVGRAWAADIGYTLEDRLGEVARSSWVNGPWWERVEGLWTYGPSLTRLSLGQYDVMRELSRFQGCLEETAQTKPTYERRALIPRWAAMLGDVSREAIRSFAPLTL